MLQLSTNIKRKYILTFQNLDCKVDARLLVLVHVVLKLRLAKLVEGDDDQGDEDVDEEERKDDEEDDVEDALLSSEPRDGAFIFISGRHGVL